MYRHMVGIAVASDGALHIPDDGDPKIWRVSYLPSAKQERLAFRLVRKSWRAAEKPVRGESSVLRRHTSSAERMTFCFRTRGGRRLENFGAWFSSVMPSLASSQRSSLRFQPELKREVLKLCKSRSKRLRPRKDFASSSRVP